LLRAGRALLRTQQDLGRSDPRNDHLTGDDNGHAGVGYAEEQPRELDRQAYAAVRRRIAGQVAAMERNPAPSEPLHVGHGCIVVEVRAMVRVSLKDREHARRGAVAWPSARDGRDADRDTVAIKHGALRRQADDKQEGPLRRHLRRPEELPRPQPLGDVRDAPRPKRWLGDGQLRRSRPRQCQQGRGNAPPPKLGEQRPQREANWLLHGRKSSRAPSRGNSVTIPRAGPSEDPRTTGSAGPAASWLSVAERSGKRRSLNTDSLGALMAAIAAGDDRLVEDRRANRRSQSRRLRPLRERDSADRLPPHRPPAGRPPHRAARQRRRRADQI